jgi:hypothetical protein
MTTAIYRAVQDVPVLGRRDALRLADQIIRSVIDDLRRDPTIPRHTFEDWHIKFAGVHARIAELLTKSIDRRADLDEVLVVIEAVV